MAYGTVTVQSSGPTLISAANNARKSIIIYNNGGVVLYLGPDALITISNAMPILPQSSLESANLFANWRGNIYGLATSGTLDVRFWSWDA